MNWKKYLKVICIVSAIVIVFWYGFRRIIIYGFSLSSCSRYEVPIETPQLMKTSDIIFEKTMYYVLTTRKESSVPGCENIRTETGNFIQADGRPYETAGYRVIQINKDTRFRLIRAAKINTNGLIDMDSGLQGSYYLLKDNNGDKYYIRDFYLTTLDGRNKPVAGYYDEDKRLGDVIIIPN